MLGEVMTVEPFHRQESLAVRRLTMRHIGNNAWMMKVGEDLRLADEALALARVAGRRVKKLESDRVAREPIGGAVDGAYSSRPGDAVDLEPVGKQVPSLQHNRVRGLDWV